MHQAYGGQLRLGRRRYHVGGQLRRASTYIKCIRYHFLGATWLPLLRKKYIPWQPASQAKCCRSTLQSFRDASAPGKHFFPAVSHTTVHDCPFSPGSACTSPGSAGSGGEGVVGLPARCGCELAQVSDAGHIGGSYLCAPEGEKQWWCGDRYAFSCTVLRDEVRHLPLQ